MNLRKRAVKRIGFFEKGSSVEIDTSRWMRPKSASEFFSEQGMDVSRATINYWINDGKIDSVKIKSLDNLTLVDIYSAPDHVVKFIK